MDVLYYAIRVLTAPIFIISLNLCCWHIEINMSKLIEQYLHHVIIERIEYISDRKLD